MFSQRFKSKYTVGAFLLLFACSPICFGENGEDGNKDNKVNVLFSYGPGGPLRPNNEFFAGEIIIFYVEADASLTKDGKFDLAVTSRLLRLSNENTGIDSFSDRQHQCSGLIFDGQSAFHVFGVTAPLPDDLTGGNYVLHVSVHDGLNNTIHQKQIPVIVKEKQEFGLRSILFVHGAPGNLTFGSNVFRASEIAVIAYAIGGLEKNNADVLDTANINTEISILNLEHEVVCSLSWRESPIIFNGFLDTAKITLPLPQPGEFIVKLRVEDTISGKADTCELPLIVLPVPSPVSAGGRSLGN